MKKNLMIIVLTIIVIILIGTTVDLYSKLENKKVKETEVQQKLEVNNSKTENSSLTKNEDDIIEYIEEIDKEVDVIIDKDDVSEKEKDTLKESFILLTDFIFYDGEIKGVKFKELRNDIKERIIELYERIDSKIEKKFPGYKENIKEQGTKTYANIKEKLTNIKNTIINEYKENVGEDRYNTIVDAYASGKNDMQEVYDEYKPYIEDGKEKGKGFIENVKDKLSKWYQEYKEG